MSSPDSPLVLLRIAALSFATLAPLAAGEALTRLAALQELEDQLAAEVARLTDALHGIAGEPPGDGDPEAAHNRLAIIALRRALHNRRRVPDSQLDALRGILPPELFAAVADHLARRAGLDPLQAEYERSFRADLLRARRSLLSLAGRPVFREGMRLVSRALLDRLAAMAGMDPARFRHDERHAAAKLTAYAARFATKTSPNSVFCATALAWISGDEAVVTGANLPARIDVLLSVAEARKISACLGADPAAGPAIVPRLNPTLRREAGEEGAWIFWRPITPRRETDMEVLSRTRAQPILDLFHEEAAKGTLNLPALLATVAERYEVSVEELTPFFERLVDTGFLIAEIEPPYNARRPLAWVAETMRAAGCDAPWLPEIEAVEQDVEALAALPSEERIAAMDRLEERLAALPHVIPLKGDVLFRLDTASGIEVTLPERVRADLEGPLRRYVRLFAGLYPEIAFRNAYAARFLSAHPADTDVPLLDLYHGLFEPEQQERPDAFPPAPPGETRAAAVLERTRELFAARARAALAAGQEEVELTEEDWDVLVGDLPEPTWSAGTLFQIAAGSPEDVGAGRYRIVLNALFGAGIALARFSHLHGGPRPDTPVAREVAKSWQPLARDGAIFAEITYNHFGRSANAGLRPTLFRHEIELLGERANPEAEVIPLTELTVRWDSGAGRFVLRWAAQNVKENVEVVPLISSGVSPEGFVSFLVEIGRQGLQPLAVFPGFDVPGISAWPRFRSGRVVLFRRRWSFTPGEAPEAPREGSDGEAARFFAQVQRWRRARSLPRHVFLHTPAEPKPFYADLDSPLSVDLLRRALLPAREGAAPPTLHVTEMLPGPDETWIADERGRYAAELLLHLSGPAGGPG
jgi:lantibiotic biosynthesis dehydratase-like protein